MKEKEIAKAALGLAWENVESQARRVAEYAAEMNPVEVIGAEFAKCRAAGAQPRDVDVLLEALNCTLKEHGFKVVDFEDEEAIEGIGEDAFRRAVEVMVTMLEEGEWAEHVAATTGKNDSLAERLEAAITSLINQASRAPE